MLHHRRPRPRRPIRQQKRTTQTFTRFHIREIFLTDKPRKLPADRQQQRLRRPPAPQGSQLQHQCLTFTARRDLELFVLLVASQQTVQRLQFRQIMGAKLSPHPPLLAGAVSGQSRGLRAFLRPESTRWQYTHGVPDPTAVSPDGYSLDDFYLARPGADEVQLDLFLDYASNVALYPKFQDYFRKHHPRFLAVWGKNDPFFLPQGAEAFKRDIPEADIRFFDTGHFALETHAEPIARPFVNA